MLRFKKSIYNCINSQRKQFVRRFSTPTLPEFADVVIIGILECSYIKMKNTKRRRRSEGNEQFITFLPHSYILYDIFHFITFHIQAKVLFCATGKWMN